MPEDKTRFSARVRNEILETMNEYAEEAHLNRSQAIERIVGEWDEERSEVPDSMREQIKRYSKALYRHTTRDTFAGTWAMAVAIILTIFAVSAFLFGVMAGASIALDGGSVAQQVAEVQAVETSVWSDMLTEGSPLSRAAYGLFHWVAVLAGWLAVVGIRLGHAIPSAGYAAEYIGRPLIWGLVLLFGLQLVRTLELAYRYSQSKRGVNA